MKTFVTVLALLVLATVVPAFSMENAPTPASVGLTASSPACSSVATGAFTSQQNNELPSWLTTKTTEPLIWSGDPNSLSWLSSGCTAYCRECGGCCAILGPNSCACC